MTDNNSSPVSSTKEPSKFRQFSNMLTCRASKFGKKYSIPLAISGVALATGVSSGLGSALIAIAFSSACASVYYCVKAKNIPYAAYAGLSFLSVVGSYVTTYISSTDEALFEAENNKALTQVVLKNETVAKKVIVGNDYTTSWGAPIKRHISAQPLCIKDPVVLVSNNGTLGLYVPTSDGAGGQGIRPVDSSSAADSKLLSCEAK